MRTVYKYALAFTDKQTITMHAGAEVLSVQMQVGPCLWAMVDTDAPPQERTFITIGTGNPMPEGPVSFIDTYQMHEGSLIFHVFEVRS